MSCHTKYIEHASFRMNYASLTWHNFCFSYARPCQSWVKNGLKLIRGDLWCPLSLFKLLICGSQCGKPDIICGIHSSVCITENECYQKHLGTGLNIVMFCCTSVVTCCAADACLIMSKWMPYSCIMADQLLALITCVREQAVVAGDAVGTVIWLDVLAAIQGFFAVVTVKTISHCNFCQPETQKGDTLVSNI